MVYMAYDGDNAGRQVGRAILADNPDALHEVSNRINLGHEVVKRWVESHGGQFISGGGDEGVFSIPADAIHSVDELRADYQFATNLTATIGVGQTLSEAGKAMLVGKFRGKNQVVMYDPSIETEIQQAQGRMQQGTASAEEKKIGEAYLQPEGSAMNQSEHASDCPYCQESAAAGVEDPNHCKYCHDVEAEEACPYCVAPAAEAAGEVHDCPYCQNPTGDDCPYCQDGAHDPSVEGHPDNCPYCAESATGGESAFAADGGDDQQVIPTAGAEVKSTTTTDSENYAGQDLNPPDLPKPDAIQHNPDGLGVTDDDGQTVNNTMLDAAGQGEHNETDSKTLEGVDPQSAEAAQEIGQEIDRIPNYVDSKAQAVNNIDAADMAVGTGVQENVSRPDDYADENHPSDMGLAEDAPEAGAPDVTALMQEGLDSHADSIQRERIVNMVSEALVGFKNCKGIIEKSKTQAPQLYDASISMLRAMIEMAKMLGLDQDAQAPVSDDAAMAQEAAIDPSLNGPKDSNPANGGLPAGNTSSGNIPQYEKKESGAAPAKKSEGAVGQSIGKLPTSATTKHVARTPQLPNAVNAKGQKKVIDPVNGRVRWIDMKEGKVRSPTGVPVKPASEDEDEQRGP